MFGKMFGFVIDNNPNGSAPWNYQWAGRKKAP